MSDITKRLAQQYERTGLDYLREATSEIERLREERERDREQRLLLGAEIELQKERIEGLKSSNDALRRIANDIKDEIAERYGGEDE